MKLTLDEARVRDQAQKVFDEDPYKERLAQVTDESRASGIKEAIEKAAEAMAAFYEQQAMYDPPGVGRLRAPQGRICAMFSTTCSESALSMPPASSKSAIARPRRPPRKNA